MTNYEAHTKEIITQIRTGVCELYRLVLAAKNIKCTDITCSECRKLTADWLEEEYKETDWSNVAVNTPVLVSDDGEHWYKRHFAEYKNGTVYVWIAGTTSWSVDTTKKTSTWKYTKLYKGESNENR